MKKVILLVLTVLALSNVSFSQTADAKYILHVGELNTTIIDVSTAKALPTDFLYITNDKYTEKYVLNSFTLTYIDNTGSSVVYPSDGANFSDKMKAALAGAKPGDGIVIDPKFYIAKDNLVEGPKVSLKVK